MGALYKRFDRHLYLGPAAPRSFIFTAHPYVRGPVRVDFNTEVDGTTANLAVLYIVLLRNRGVDKYADAFAAIGAFDLSFVELSRSHLASRPAVFRGFTKRPRTNPKPACNNGGGKNRITNREHPGRGLIIQNRFQPMRNERTRVHGRARAFSQCHFPGC